jgi:hypothetical protein
MTRRDECDGEPELRPWEPATRAGARRSRGAADLRLPASWPAPNAQRLLRCCAAVGLALTFAGIASPAEAPPRGAPAPILVTPKDRVLLQRGFVPVGGALRLYACLVGTPAGVHYAYDFESGALLSVWRGEFADMVEIWGPRARNQTARPAGREVAVAAKPLIALFSNRPMIAFPQTWPEQPAPLYESLGYELEPDGQPVFLAKIERLAIRDRIAAEADGRGLRRTLEFSGALSPWETWLLLAEADTIAAHSGGRGWSAGAGEWTIEWSADSPHRPVVRAEGARQLLVLRLDRAKLHAPVEYLISW